MLTNNQVTIDKPEYHLPSVFEIQVFQRGTQLKSAGIGSV